METLSLAALISKVDPFTDKNWYKWKNQIIMIFHMDGSTALIAGTEQWPNNETEATKWDRCNLIALGLIWASTHAIFLFLVEKETFSSACIAKFKTKFESMSFVCQVELCKQFYSVKCNLSKPINICIQQILDAKGQLVTIGHKIENVEVKDIILMNLHSSYETIKLSLLTQPTELSLNVICSILNLLSPIIDVPFTVKSKSTNTALATKFMRSGSNKRVSHRHVSGSSDSGHGTSVGGIEDNKGYHWGDVMSDNCHHCRHEGHIATLCVADMPPDIKSQILSNSLTKNKWSLYICNSHSCSPSSPSHHVSFCAYSH
jgi:hypothetical protein